MPIKTEWIGWYDKWEPPQEIGEALVTVKTPTLDFTYIVYFVLGLSFCMIGYSLYDMIKEYMKSRRQLREELNSEREGN